VSELTLFQKQLFEKVEQCSRKRADETIKKAKLSAQQRRALGSARKKLEHSLLIVNLALRSRYNGGLIIDGVLELGRLINYFELRHFREKERDEYFQTRLLVEFKLYGATSDLQEVFKVLADDEHPHYAAVDYLNHGSSIPTLRGYGKYRFALKNELKERSTLTPSDSFFAESDQVYVWGDRDGILASRPLADDHFWFEHVVNGTEPKSAKKGRSYIEAQILGGVSLHDVETVYYPAVDRLDPDFFEKLKRFETNYGITLKEYGNIMRKGDR
jgi:hypothetical protein